MRVQRSIRLLVMLLALAAGTGCNRSGGSCGGISIYVWIWGPANPPAVGLPGSPYPDYVPPSGYPDGLKPPPSWSDPIDSLLPPPAGPDLGGRVNTGPGLGNGPGGNPDLDGELDSGGLLGQAW